MSPKRVGFLLCPAVQALDLVGPMDAFSAVAFADGSNGQSLRAQLDVAII
jgi:hypothetical protein